MHTNLWLYHIGRREEQIKRLQKEFGYSRSNAEKLYEYHRFQGQQFVFNMAFGAFIAYKAQPFHDAAAKSFPLFRKSWMALPIRGTAFMMAYYFASQIQNKIFAKYNTKFRKDPMNRGINGNTYLHNQDLISKFRFFENDGASADA